MEANICRSPFPKKKIQLKEKENLEKPFIEYRIRNTRLKKFIKNPDTFPKD